MLLPFLAPVRTCSRCVDGRNNHDRCVLEIPAVNERDATSPGHQDLNDVEGGIGEIMRLVVVFACKVLSVSRC